jgi:hypothetical protein
MLSGSERSSSISSGLSKMISSQGVLAMLERLYSRLSLGLPYFRRPALLSAQPLDDLSLGLLSCFLCAIHEAALFIKCLQSSREK